MLQQQTKLWNDVYAKANRMMYPAEPLVQMFRGNYPQCQLSRVGYSGKSILDVGCGDGRHLCFF